MTKTVTITNGNLTGDPTVKILDDGTAVWNFTMAENHADESSLWTNFSFFADRNHPVLKKAKKGATLQVFGKFAFKLDEYTFSHKPEKKSFSIKLQVTGVDWGTFDTPKEKGDAKPQTEETVEDIIDSPESFFPPDELIPPSQDKKMDERMKQMPLGVEGEELELLS